jgi:hypothetical protein
MTGYTDEVAKALHLRKYGVPYEGLVYVFLVVYYHCLAG